MKKILTAAIVAMLCISVGIPFFGYSYRAYAESYEADSLEQLIDGIIEWKKSVVHSDLYEGNYLLNVEFVPDAGTTNGDWFPIGLGRYGYEDNYGAYLSVLTDQINMRYQTDEKLSKAKATEWHRISLAVAASGGDPTSIGEYNGEPIDLIADGTYNRGLTASPGRQGINGWIWALISLDSKRYEVPENAFHQRQDFIVEILQKQLEDGGFALSGKVSDPDITAMAVQALAPYYNSEIVYEYTSEKIKKADEDGTSVYIQCQKSVRQVVDECVAWLSSVQAEDGDFYSWGMQNVESTCQVVVALTSLGIDPLMDERFITDSGNTLLDGILKYRLDNGGFVHSFTYDPDNPTSLPDEANEMASHQSLYTLVALWRNQNGMRTLYDMRPEFTDKQKGEILQAEQAISALSDSSEKTDVAAALGKYIAVDALDRNYVHNYWKLSSLAKKYQLELPEEDLVFSGNDSGSDGMVTMFMQSDADAVGELPAVNNLTTEHYVAVVTFFEKLKNAENKNDFQNEYIALEKAYNQICAIQAEIDDIKAAIKEQLYPFDWIGLDKRNEVHTLYGRYMALSEYDRSQFEASDIEGLLKCKTQVDNLLTALIVGLGCCVAAAVTIVSVVLHIRMRRKKKAAEEMVESDE
ncbi:MAG: prenyltransferase/squalene oxidase repeat-containing protein [Eubacteriales bacterium]|nr:terpene cyclase/mutase family protein [Christensenellaceae bacterium]MDY3242071.1 prenyltransferase/squalene oxidase repeat-containing protein [Eubacteriales bacterium]